MLAKQCRIVRAVIQSTDIGVFLSGILREFAIASPVRFTDTQLSPS